MVVNYLILKMIYRYYLDRFIFLLFLTFPKTFRYSIDSVQKPPNIFEN